jgi:hypothetical protein
MALSKSDYIQWRDSKETQELMKELGEAAESVAQEVLTREDYNSDRDQFLKGYLKAIDQVIGWRPEFIEENNNEG